jgi:hypothetical protein
VLKLALMFLSPKSLISTQTFLRFGARSKEMERRERLES